MKRKKKEKRRGGKGEEGKPEEKRGEQRRAGEGRGGEGRAGKEKKRNVSATCGKRNPDSCFLFHHIHYITEACTWVAEKLAVTAPAMKSCWASSMSEKGKKPAMAWKSLWVLTDFSVATRTLARRLEPLRGSQATVFFPCNQSSAYKPS